MCYIAKVNVSQGALRAHVTGVKRQREEHGCSVNGSVTGHRAGYYRSRPLCSALRETGVGYRIFRWDRRLWRVDALWRRHGDSYGHLVSELKAAAFLLERRML